MSTKIINAIKKINPNAVVSVGFENVNGDSNNLNDVSLTWHNGTTPIPKADIEAKMVEVQADYDAKQYQRDRTTAYPSIQEQLDMQYWDSVNGTTTWKDAVAKVKADNPKP